MFCCNLNIAQEYELTKYCMRYKAMFKKWIMLLSNYFFLVKGRTIQYVSQPITYCNALKNANVDLTYFYI